MFKKSKQKIIPGQVWTLYADPFKIKQTVRVVMVKAGHILFTIDNTTTTSLPISVFTQMYTLVEGPVVEPNQVWRRRGFGSSTVTVESVQNGYVNHSSNMLCCTEREETFREGYEFSHITSPLKKGSVWVLRSDNPFERKQEVKVEEVWNAYVKYRFLDAGATSSLHIGTFRELYDPV